MENNLNYIHRLCVATDIKQWFASAYDIISLLQGLMSYGT